jgi:hypothetical protein
VTGDDLPWPDDLQLAATANIGMAAAFQMSRQNDQVETWLARAEALMRKLSRDPEAQELADLPDWMDEARTKIADIRRAQDESRAGVAEPQSVIEQNQLPRDSSEIR